MPRTPAHVQRAAALKYRGCDGADDRVGHDEGRIGEAIQEIAAFQAFAKSRGAAELMIPAEIMIVPKLPLLGSGKVDLVSVAKLVRERVPAPEKPVAAE